MNRSESYRSCGRSGWATVSKLVIAMAVVTGTSVPGTSLAEETEGAEEHFRRGVALFDAGIFTRAAEEFAAAYKISPEVPVLANLAMTHDKLGHYLTAA